MPRRIHMDDSVRCPREDCDGSVSVRGSFLAATHWEPEERDFEIGCCDTCGESEWTDKERATITERAADGDDGPACDEDYDQ